MWKVSGSSCWSGWQTSPPGERLDLIDRVSGMSYKRRPERLREGERRMDEVQRRVDEIRGQRSELENHLIDEYSYGKISRREFVRRGTVVGMSIPLVSFLAAACGGDDEGGAGATTTGAEPAGDIQQGGTIRVALIQPTTEPNPLLVQ